MLELWKEEIRDFFGLWGLTLPLSTSSRTALIGETANSAGFPCNNWLAKSIEYATPIICNASGASGKSSREVKTAPDSNNPTLATPPNNASFANPSFPTCFFASCNASDTVIFPYFFFAACKASFICCRLPWPNICAAASKPFLLCRVSWLVGVISRGRFSSAGCRGLTFSSSTGDSSWYRDFTKILAPSRPWQRLQLATCETETDKLQACDDNSLEVGKFAATDDDDGDARQPWLEETDDDDDDDKQPWLEEGATTACAILLSNPALSEEVLHWEKTSVHQQRFHKGIEAL